MGCSALFYMFTLRKLPTPWTLRKLPTLIILSFLQAQHNFLWQQKWMCFSFLVWKALILKNYSSSCCLFGEYLQHSPHLQTEITGPSSKLSLLWVILVLCCTDSPVFYNPIVKSFIKEKVFQIYRWIAKETQHIKMQYASYSISTNLRVQTKYERMQIFVKV